MSSRKKIKEMIKKEIILEDKMMGLYSEILKDKSILQDFKENDRNIVKEILEILLRDTARHKKIIENLLMTLGE